MYHRGRSKTSMRFLSFALLLCPDFRAFRGAHLGSNMLRMMALLLGIVAGVSAFQPALPAAGSLRMLGTSSPLGKSWAESDGLDTRHSAPKRGCQTSPHLFGNIFGGNSNQVCYSLYPRFSCDWRNCEGRQARSNQHALLCVTGSCPSGRPYSLHV